MGELFLTGRPVTAQEWSLLVLIVLIGVLFAGTITLSVYAVVMRSIHQASDRRSQALTERWLDPVLLAVTDPTTVSSVHELVQEKDALHFVSFVIEYARRVRGEERAAFRALVKPYLPEMAKRLDSRRTEMRAWAVQTLGTLGLPEYETEVVAALDDRSPLVAMVAARALAREETPQYADAILARLERFQVWSPPFLASMLAAIGPSVSEVLRRGLADERAQPWTRAVLAEALKLQGDFLAGDIAVDVITRTDDRELLAATLRLLSAVGRPDHVDVVRPLCSSPDPVVRSQALRAMWTIGGSGDIAELLEAMDDPSPWPALYAARGVRDSGGREALVRLAESGHPSAGLAAQVLGEETGS